MIRDTQQLQCRPGLPIEGAKAPSTGTLHGVMVFVDFSDAQATESTQDLYDILEPNATEWYKTMSYGKLELDIVPHKDKFYRMPKASTAYDFQRGLSAEAHRVYIQDALDVIGKSVSFTGANVLYIVPTKAAVAISFTPTAVFPVTAADGTVIGNTVTLGQDTYTNWGYKVINHETGHTMGLPDLYPFAANGTTVQWVGGFSIMGLITGQSPDYFAYHKWQLGWLDDSQVDCVVDNGTTTHHISPVESGSGTKMVMIPLDQELSLVAEVRSREGINTDACGVGVLMYFSDTSKPTGYGPIRVIDATPNSGGCDPDIGGELNDAPFQLGTNATSSFRDNGYGLIVTLLEKHGDDYVIRVQRNANNGTAPSGYSNTSTSSSGIHSAKPTRSSPGTASTSPSSSPSPSTQASPSASPTSGGKSDSAAVCARVSHVMYALLAWSVSLM